MQNKRFFLIFVFFYLLGDFSSLPFVEAKTISVKEARFLAQNWLHKSDYFDLNSDGLIDWHLKDNGRDFILFQKDGETPVLAIAFQLEPRGFIMVAGDERMNPILAFSRESNFVFENKKSNFAIDWITTDIASRLRAISEGIAPAGLLKKNRLFREKLIRQQNVETELTERRQEIYGPYLDSQWGQGNVDGVRVFNLLTPNHWSAGCVATAMAQILDYYKWPVHGAGRHKYNEDDAGVISVNFDSTYYDWKYMLDVYTLGSTEIEREAAALLAFHCGVALNMDYESNGSTASTKNVPSALSDYFRFTGEYEKSSRANFYKNLRTEMIEGRPAQLAISTSSGFGHSVDVDGYFEHNGYFHLNMGWNGKNNGWYDLAGSFYVSGYSIVDGAVIHIFPVPEIMDSTFTLQGDSILVGWRKSFRSQPEKYEIAFSLDDGNDWISFSNTIQDTVMWISSQSIIPNGENVGSIEFKARAFEKNQWWGWSKSNRLQIHSDRLITFQVNLGGRVLGLGEQLVVRGNIPPLGGYVNSPPFEFSDSLGIYRLTVAFDYSHVGQTLRYRFAIVGPNTVEMENQTRIYTITSGENQVIPFVYFNDFANKIENRLENKMIRTFQIFPNYPNPFLEKTKISFYLPEGQKIRVTIYNILGEKIADLFNDRFQTSGEKHLLVNFNSLESEYGRPLPKGVYFIRFRTKNIQKIQKIIFE